MSAPLTRERRRRALKASIAHFTQPSYGLPAREAHLYAAREALAELPIGGVLPDIPGPLIAHCGGWHAVTTLPLTLPCCGTVFFRREAPCHHVD
mgnify:FL=1